MKKEDVRTETNGKIFFPVYKLLIRNQEDKILKTYQKENCYIVDCNIVENQIALKRIQKKETGEFYSIEDDYITSNDIENKNVTKVSTVVMDKYKKVVQLVLKNTPQINSLKFMSAKEVIFEGARDVNLELGKKQDVFYVYGPKGVNLVTTSSAEAVKMAYEISGSVVDGDGNYIWKKGTIHTRNQIISQVSGLSSSLSNSIFATAI